MSIISRGLAIAAISIAFAGCGSSGETNEKTETASVATTPTATPTPTPTKTPEPTPTPKPTGCDELGMNRAGGKTGECIGEDGTPLSIANKADSVKLREMRVSLNGVTTSSAVGSDIGSEAASGTYVSVSLTVENRLDAPTYFDADQVLLALGEKVYTHDFDAENLPGDSCVWNDDEIQPEQSTQCSVIFDVPTKRLKELDRSGNVSVLQFSDAGSDYAEKRIAIFRTYR